MLNEFLYPLADYFQPFNLFKYITFRTFGAILTALGIALVIGKPFIAWLRVKQGKGQPIREDGPASHLLTKKGTPTMGGFLIWIALGASGLLWADLKNPFVWVVLAVAVAYGAIGFIDDYEKVTKQKTDGLSSSMRLFLEFIVAFVAVAVISALHAAHTPIGHADWGPLTPIAQHIARWAPETTIGVPDPQFSNSIALPFVKEMVAIGPFFLLFGMVVIVGSANAVNFTDGLDGLAIGPVMIAAMAFGIIAYVTGNAVFAKYLGIHFTPGTGELAVVMGALIGAGLGFLWYNAPPASVFMGDTGSLALGGLLGVVAVAAKHEFALAIVGGVFVLEAMSVIIQVGWYKLTKKRVFRMAPIHHHFEKEGWAETKVVIRFWILALVFALIGLATLKLR